jgi:hypothetical protein
MQELYIVIELSVLVESKSFSASPKASFYAYRWWKLNRAMTIHDYPNLAIAIPVLTGKNCR